MAIRPYNTENIKLNTAWASPQRGSVIWKPL